MAELTLALHLESVLDDISDAIHMLDREFRLTYVNAKAAETAGLNREGMLGTSIWALYPAVVDTPFQSEAQRAMRERIPTQLELFCPVLKSWFEHRWYPIKGGVALFSLCSPERKQTAAALPEIQAHKHAHTEDFGILMEAIPANVIIAHDADCSRVTGNRHAYEKWQLPVGTNIPPRSLAGNSQSALKLLVNGVAVQPTECPLRRAARGEFVLGCEVELTIPGTEEERIGYVNAVPLLNEDGTVRGAILVEIDITERKRAEEALRLSEHRFQTALKHSPFIVFNKDRDLRYTWIHRPEKLAPELESFFSNDAVGKRLSELLEHPEHAEDLERLGQQVLETGQGIHQQGWIRIGGSDFCYDVTHEPLRNSVGQIEGITGAIVDITAHKALEKELREQAEQLQMADQRKNEFLAILAHELRNPLAPISNAGDILGLSKSAADPDVEWVRGVLSRQMKQITRLLDDLLDEARITRGRIRIKKELINLTATVNHAVESTRPLIESRDHRLNLSLPADPVHVHGDAARLNQVVANLLNNAACYTEIGGEIWVSICQEKETATITVRDTGTGIPPGVLPFIFEPFSRLNHSPEHANAGLGLGLALARALVEQHGGKIQVVSSPLGQGSEFIVRLPAVATEQASSRPAESMATEPKPYRQGVLLVEDDPAVSDSCCRLLQALGHEVRAVCDGPSALAAVHALKPDVVLLDLGLPGVSGYEVARQLRQEHQENTPVLVALSGWGQGKDNAAARDAGFDRCLLKPITAADLNLAISQ